MYVCIFLTWSENYKSSKCPPLPFSSKDAKKNLEAVWRLTATASPLTTTSPTIATSRYRFLSILKQPLRSLRPVAVDMRLHGVSN